MKKNPWRDVLKETQKELKRLSQDVDGCRMLPDCINIRLNEKEFSAWAPILDSVVRDFGLSLQAWADKRGHRWLDAEHPNLCMVLVAGEGKIDCAFRADKEDSSIYVSAETPDAPPIDSRTRIELPGSNGPTAETMDSMEMSHRENGENEKEGEGPQSGRLVLPPRTKPAVMPKMDLTVLEDGPSDMSLPSNLREFPSLVKQEDAQALVASEETSQPVSLPTSKAEAPAAEATLEENLANGRFMATAEPRARQMDASLKSRPRLADRVLLRASDLNRRPLTPRGSESKRSSKPSLMEERS